MTQNRKMNFALPRVLRDGVVTSRTPVAIRLPTDEAGRRVAGAARVIADELADEFDAAVNWLDLQRRLRARGFVLRLDATGGLYLHVWPSDRRLLPVEALDHTLESLSQHFRAVFPGASAHKWVARPRRSTAA